MTRSVARDSATASAAAPRSARMRTISAESAATAVPEPIAIPRSAAARAGASLMPSPTTATVRPACCKAVTTACLPSGRTPAYTRSRGMPTRSATACAVRSSSPVRRYAVRPSAASRVIAARELGRTVSVTVKAARAVPSQPT